MSAKSGSPKNSSLMSFSSLLQLNFKSRKTIWQKCTQPKPSRFYIHHTQTLFNPSHNHQTSSVSIYVCIYIYIYVFVFVLTGMPLMNTLFKGWPGNIGHKTSSTKHGSHDRIIKLAPIVVHPTSRNGA